jgi:predicted CXXCH cytochrome family protein
MSFIVRTVARTADGRDIIRPKAFSQAELTIGRGTDNDIHLPDLAVTLHHAVIRTAGAGQIQIAATAGLPFIVDDKSVEHATINVNQGAIVRLGAHALTIAGGEGDEAGSTIITVERVGAVSNASEAKEEAHVFSLAKVLPGKRPLAWALVLLVLGIFLIWPLVTIHATDPKAVAKPHFHADEMWSSGGLSSVHKSLENNCKACHTKAGVAVRDDACVACHTKVHDHADPKKLAVAMGSPGFVAGSKQMVGKLFGIQPGRCVECHKEHEGAKAMPTTDEKFCTNCHADMSKRLTDTKLANVGDFGADHPQFMPTIRSLGAGGLPIFRRASLDANPQEDNGLKFPHKLHLSTTNGVAQMALTLGGEGYGKPLQCANCHVRDATGNTFVPVTMEKNCAACHSLAFDQVNGTVRTLRHGDPAQVIADIRAFYRSSGQFRSAAVQGMARRRPGDFSNRAVAVDYAQSQVSRGGNAESAIRAVFSKGGACFDCHVVTPTGNAATPYKVAPVVLAKRYMAKGWFDHASHDTESCASCHNVAASMKATDVNLPKIGRCRDCHGGQDAHKEVPSACALCHDYHRTAFAPLMVRTDHHRGHAIEHIDEKTIKAGGGI